MGRVMVERQVVRVSVTGVVNSDPTSKREKCLLVAPSGQTSVISMNSITSMPM